MGRRTVSVIVYAERFEANVRLTKAAGRQLWEFRGNGQPSHQQLDPISRDDGTVDVARCRPVAAITMTAYESAVDGFGWAFPER